MTSSGGGSGPWHTVADLVVVGSGVAGLTAALEAGKAGLRVLVVTKGAIDESSTRLAQGGVAVVFPEDRERGDSVADHVEDTLGAGAGLCDPEAVAQVLFDGASAVSGLRARGAAFDTGPDSQLARGREGGHRAFRIVHAGGDATGAEVERALVVAARSQAVPVLERHTAVSCRVREDGAVTGLTLRGEDGTLGTVGAPAVLLATGGAGHLYEQTSNPVVATADGLAVALRAGAVLADLEFVQFHPTTLFTGRGVRGRQPLITEAVRGEGAVLVDGAGRRVMEGVHPLEDLAPRDVVAAAITRRLAAAPGGVDDHVYLDATALAGTDFPARFPTAYRACRAIGVDPVREPIPVTPAAHFACGGVLVTVDGRSSVTGLYAAGEVARTGLHGANRLASNSLLEGLVGGSRAARAVARDLAAGDLASPAVGEGPAEPPSAEAVDRPALQAAMTRHAGIGRDAAGLAAAATALHGGARRALRTRNDLEDAALTLVARALVESAAAREESRGCHVRTDFPDTDDLRWRRSLTVRLDGAGRPALAEPLALGGAA